MWVPPEVRDPIVWQAPTRKQIGIYGAVRLRDGQLMAWTSSLFNGETFEEFLEMLLPDRARKRKMCLILDNSRYHHAHSLRGWLRKNEKLLRLEFLPPYSPQLNPIERVWKLTRRICTHNRYFPSLEELILVIERQFNIWATPNETLRRLCAIN